MSNTTHTPGPWYTCSKPDSLQGLVSAENTGKTVALTYDPKDAPLVAAAPELLAVLEGVIQLWDDLYCHESDPGEQEVWGRVRALIAKAKGE